MKQGLKVILFSSVVGTILAGLFFLSVKEKAEAKMLSTVYAYQVGVFKNKDNALATLSNYENAKIVLDNDLYRIFIGVTINAKDYLSAYFDELGYSYYIKEIELDENLKEDIKKYDDVLMKTNKESNQGIIKQMLESIPNEL